MSRSLGDLKSDIYRNLGRDDSTAESIIETAVNIAIELASLIFDIPELRYLGEITFSEGIDELFISGDNRLMDIIKARNTTNGIELGFVPIERLDLVSPTSGSVCIYSRDGNAMLVRPAPTESTVVKVRYSVYPVRLTDDADLIPFEGHDGYILSVATTIAFAAFEEIESSGLWNKIQQIAAVPYAKASIARKVIEGIKTLKED